MAEPQKTRAKTSEDSDKRRVVIACVLTRDKDDGPVTGILNIKIQEKDLSAERIDALKRAKPLLSLVPEGEQWTKEADPTAIFGILYEALTSMDNKAVQKMRATHNDTEELEQEDWYMVLYDNTMKPKESLLEEGEIPAFNPVFEC